MRNKYLMMGEQAERQIPQKLKVKPRSKGEGIGSRGGRGRIQRGVWRE
jgi:hypothetical protein